MMRKVFISKSDINSFFPIYKKLTDAILDELKPDEREGCAKAFSEIETCYLLYTTIHNNHSSTIIETGTYLGLSAFICAASMKNYKIKGKVYSISLNNFYKTSSPLLKASRVAQKLGLSQYIHFLEGSSTPIAFMETSDPRIAKERKQYLLGNIIKQQRESLLYKLAAVLNKHIDLVYLDGLHYEMFQMSELSAILGSISANGSIFIDDVLPQNNNSDVQQIIYDIKTGNFSFDNFIQFLKFRGRFYTLPWIICAFRNTKLATINIYQSEKSYLRIAKITPNQKYQSPHGILSTWFSSDTLLELLKKYEFRP